MIASVAQIVNLGVSAIDTFKSMDYAEIEKKQSNNLHEKVIKQTKLFLDDNLLISKQTYLIESTTNLEQHIQQLNLDLFNNSRESERDMFDQRNQQFQTIILSAAVMFAALSTVIFESSLPVNSGTFIYVAYSVVSSLSFSFLFICIVLCIEIVAVSSEFMYNKANKHKDKVIDLINKNKTIIKDLENSKNMIKCENEDEEHLAQNKNEKILAQNVRTPSPQHKTKREHNNKINNTLSNSFIINEKVVNDINEQFKTHHIRIKESLRSREKENEEEEDVETFEHFWEDNCKKYGKIALLFFYCGTSNLLLAIMLYMWSNFFIIYDSIVSSVIAVSLIGSSLLISITIPTLIATKTIRFNSLKKKDIVEKLQEDLEVVNTKLHNIKSEKIRIEHELSKHNNNNLNNNILNNNNLNNNNLNNNNLNNNNLNNNNRMRLDRTTSVNLIYPDMDVLQSPRENSSLDFERNIINNSNTSKFSTPSTNISTPSGTNYV